MSNESNARNGKDWIKIAALALMPTLAAAFLTLGLGGDTEEAAAETVPSSTTTMISAEPDVTYDPADYGLDEIPEQDLVEEGVGPAASEEDEAPADDSEDDPPAAALLALPDSVEADGDGLASIEVSNLGELPLDIFAVDVNGHPIEVGEVAAHVAGYASETIELTVDTTGLPMGDYSMTVTISTSDGVGDVKVEGWKGFVFIPLVPDVDVPNAYVLPHGANQLKIELVNNAGYAVTVDLSSEDGRLVFPEEVGLAPGDNTVDIIVQALPVQPQVIDILELTVSWAGTELGTIQITKHGS